MPIAESVSYHSPTHLIKRFKNGETAFLNIYSGENIKMKQKNLISAALAMAILLAAGLACSNYGTKLDYNGGELYYTKNVTEGDAKKLGDYLVKEKFFDGAPKTVQLDKDGSTYQFRMVVQKEKQNDPATISLMKSFATEVSADVFGNAPVEVHVCDDQLKTLQVVKP